MTKSLRFDSTLVIGCLVIGYLMHPEFPPSRLPTRPRGVISKHSHVNFILEYFRHAAQ
jgi:hypothetical protein